MASPTASTGSRARTPSTGSASCATAGSAPLARSASSSSCFSRPSRSPSFPPACAGARSSSCRRSRARRRRSWRGAFRRQRPTATAPGSTAASARARRTAEIIASPHGLTPTVIPQLREMAMGRWEGRTAAEIRESDPTAFADWMARIGEFPFPEGESVPDLRARAWPAFEAIVAAHEGEAVAVVAHGGTNRALLCAALGLPLARLLALGQDYGALSVLARIGARWELRRLNEHAVL